LRFVACDDISMTEMPEIRRNHFALRRSAKMTHRLSFEVTHLKSII